MQNRTIFEIPVISNVMCWLSKRLLKLFGWKLEGQFPKLDKYVVIAAPHTSNWDFPLTLGFCFAHKQSVHWMGKHTLFKGPMGPIMRFLGGVSVDRRQANSLVDQVTDSFEKKEKFVIIIPPEGTRKKADRWKTGFYHIAQKANVPIVMAYIDFVDKIGGIGQVFTPTGDLEKDMECIQQYYAQYRGKHQHQS